jgi:hypothetical protein
VGQLSAAECDILSGAGQGAGSMQHLCAVAEFAEAARCELQDPNKKAVWFAVAC